MTILQNLENAYRAQAPTIRFSMGGVGIASIPEDRDVHGAQAEINACKQQLEDLVNAFDILRESGHLTAGEQDSPLGAARGILRALEERKKHIIELQQEVDEARRGPVARLPESEQYTLLNGEPYFVLRAGVTAHANLVQRLDPKLFFAWREWYDSAIGPKPGQRWQRKGKPEKQFTVSTLATDTGSSGFMKNETKSIVYRDDWESSTYTILASEFIEQFEPVPPRSVSDTAP